MRIECGLNVGWMRVECGLNAGEAGNEDGGGSVCKYVGSSVNNMSFNS
jgi:hypothetical protein